MNRTALALLTFLSLLVTATPGFAQSDAEVAARYAPVIYQEFSIYEDQPLDYLRRVDFDGDWDTTNNLDNAEKKGVDNRGYVYFEVKETATHYFVTYYLYYARRARIFDIKSESHSAGCVVVARKGAPAGQEIELFFTTGSGDELKVVQTENAKRWDRKKIENERTGRKGKVRTTSTMAFDDDDIDPLRNHPRLHVDCWSHKTRIRRRPKDTANDSPYPFLSGRGVVYHPHPTVSLSPVRPGTTVVGYALLPLSELEKVKGGAGKSRLPGSNKSKAKLPRAWEIPAPGFPKGALLKDPARVVATLFEVRGDFSRDYVKRGENKSGLSKALAGAAKQ